MSDQPLAAPVWDRRRESNDSGYSNASSLPASINQRPRLAPDGYQSANIVQPIPTTSMTHRNPFQNPSPGPESPLALQAPSAPWAGRPTSSHSNASVNLSIQYVPSKFSRPLSPGISYRKANAGAGRPGGLAKTGRGTDAFATTAGRMGKTGPGRLHWNRFKWILFFTNTVLTVYAMAALIFCLMIWFNVWHDAQVIRVGNHGELAASTVAACACLLTSLLGWSGLLLNNRSFLAVYTLFLWISFGLLVVPGYITYRKRTFNLEGKINFQWSRGLTATDRLDLQNLLNCCGYYNPFLEATLSAKCYARSMLPGCKGPFFGFEKDKLKTWYIMVFSLVPLHLMCMVAALLCSNHVTYRFGKGMMPKAYRLNAEAMAVIMDTYASQLAEQYADDASDHGGNARSRSTIALIDTLGYYMNAGNGMYSRDSSQSEHDQPQGAQPMDVGSPGQPYGSYGSSAGLVGGEQQQDYPPRATGYDPRGGAGPSYGGGGGGRRI